MNWNIEIRRKFPKSHKLYREWQDKLYIEEGNDRDLYDFFDENKIYGIVDFYIAEEGIEWEYKIKTRSGFMDKKILSGGYKDRKEAESEMFRREFEILENKIKE